MTKHTLKAWKVYFQALWDGDKTFELRQNDRNYQVGDTLEIREYDHLKCVFLDRVVLFRVSYIMKGGEGEFGVCIAKGWVILGLQPMMKRYLS